MAETITRVEYYMGAVPNKVGEGARVLSAFKEAGVNLTGFLGYPKTARNAEVVVIVPEKTPNVLKFAKKTGVQLGPRQKGYFITGEDRTGVGAELTGKLAAAGVNIVSLHALANEGRYAALLVIAAADQRKAAKILGV